MHTRIGVTGRVKGARRTVHRLAVATIATALIGVGLVAGAAPANADATMSFSCKILSSSIPWTTPVVVTLAPASPKAGASATATVNFTGGYKTGPVTVPANKTVAKMFANMNGSSKSQLGTPNPAVLAPNAPFSFAPIKMTFRAKSGVNTIKLTKVEFRYLDNGPGGADLNTGLDTICTPTSATTIDTFTVATTSTTTKTPSKTTKTKTTTTKSTTKSSGTGTITTTSGAMIVKTGGTTTTQQSAAKPTTGLPRTGSDDAWRSGVAALVALQLGLILAIRTSRKTRRKVS